MDLYTWIQSLIIHDYWYVAIHNVSFYTVESCVQKLFVTPRDIFLKGLSHAVRFRQYCQKLTDVGFKGSVK